MKSPAPATFGRPRDFLDNRFVYLVISSRSRGLMIGLNLSPTRACSFQCVYCEVDRSVPGVRLEIPAMISELERTLMFVYSRQILEHSYYRNLDPDLLELRGVLLSGDGEPTLCPVFSEVVEAVDDLRCRGRYPFFKLILPTNTTGLSFAKNQAGLDRLTLRDEIWVKLDVGTQGYMARVNRTGMALDEVLNNIRRLAKRRPVVVQSLFSRIEGEDPSAAEIEAYALQLKKLRDQGANISLVQIYSATRPTAESRCRHLPLKTLSEIAKTVRAVSGLRAEVF